MATATIAAPPGAEVDTGGGKKKKKMLALLLVIAVAAGAGWWFFLKPAPADAASQEPKPGAVVTLEPITINLASGHYLKLGLSLQQKEGGHGEADGAQALDLAIDLFSGRSINDLANREKREKLKHELIEHIAEAYHHDVYTIYFTEFVWQ